MYIKSYELVRDELRASIILVAQELEKYLSAMDTGGDFSDAERAKRAHYESTSALISAMQRAERVSATVSKLTLESDAENDTILALKFAELLDSYMVARRTIEEYLFKTDGIIVKGKDIFPVFSVKQSADMALRKIKILLNDKI